MVASPTKKPATPDQNKADDAQMVRTGGSMAIATLISRITGFLRAVMISAVLGGAVASAFNTANTLPNLVTELVLGAVLTSLVVPVLVRAEKEDPDGGESFIRRLMTLTFSLTLVVTILSVLFAPLLVRISLDEEGFVNVQMSTSFAYLLLPQIVFYAMFAVFMAVLNTKGVFKPGAWAPVANNVITLAVLALYLLLPDETKLQPTDHVTITNPHVLLLGVGTSLGVVVQALIMVPYLRKAGISLRPLWGLDERLKSFGGMAVAIVVYVAISQLGWILNNRIAGNSWDTAPTVYMQAWQLLQMPYGVIGVTLLTAVMPRLSRNAADGDDKAVVRDLTVASKLTMLAMVPVIVFYTCFGTLIATALFAYANFTTTDANVLGWTVSFSAFTLIPYALVLLHLRVFYAREEVWTPTFIIAGITVTKLALAYTAPLIATEPRLVVVLLGAANGFGFLAGAIIGDRLLRRSLGDLQFRKVTQTVLWSLGASLLGALVAWRVDVLIHRFLFPDPVNPWMLIRLVIAGVVFLGVTGVVLLRAPLPEIRMISAALGRIPGMARLLPSSSRRPSAPESSESLGEGTGMSAQELAARESAGMDGSMMGTALPPLSAGRVRGPRLVPGAPLLEGRYRLLADHGGPSSARMWQGREMETGAIVALTIMDPYAYVKAYSEPGEFVNPNGAPVRQAKAEMLRRSGKLKELSSAAGREGIPGLAEVQRVIDYGSLVVVVSAWVQGSPLKSVAETEPDPHAAGVAVAALADAAAAAEEAGTCLGLDHRDRLRVTTQGTAVLAFPGVLPNNSSRQDVHGVGVAMGLLLEHVPAAEVPESTTELYAKISQLGTQGVTADQLRAVAAEVRGDASGELQVTEDSTPDPSGRAGFGAERNRAGNLVTAGGMAFITVVLLATLIALVISVVGGNRTDSPLSTDSLRQGAEAISESEPAVVPLQGARTWMPQGGRGTYDNPGQASLIVDGNPTTQWASDVYLNQLGPGPESVKSGIGLLVTLPAETRLHSVSLQGLAPGTTFELRSATGNPATVEDATLLQTVTVTPENAGELVVPLDKKVAEPSTTSAVDGHPAETTAPVNPRRPKGDRLLIWITQLPMPNGVTISEVTATGTWKGMSGEETAPASTPAPAP